MKQRSIRQHVAWLTLTPLLIITVSLEAFFLQDHFFDLDRNLLERGQLIARQLASGSEYGVFANNLSFLKLGAGCLAATGCARGDYSECRFRSFG
jgi:two-component system sensor histidine kinase BarA